MSIPTSLIKGNDVTAKEAEFAIAA